jgi:hypothetical protein
MQALLDIAPAAWAKRIRGASPEKIDSSASIPGFIKTINDKKRGALQPPPLQNVF